MDNQLFYDLLILLESEWRQTFKVGGVFDELIEKAGKMPGVKTVDYKNTAMTYVENPMDDWLEK